LAQFFLEREIFGTKGAENIKHILCSITFFFENRAVFWIMWKNIAQLDRSRWKYSTAHVHCILDTLLTYLLTYSIEQSPSWEANWSAASQEIPRNLRNPKVHHRTRKRTPPVPILS